MARRHDINPDNTNRDDLKSLGGIGPFYAQALQRIGIHTYADLARYTPKELSKALQERAGVKISEKKIDSGNWISNARAAVAAKALPHPEQQPTPSTAPNQTATHWQEHASFAIYFEKMVDSAGVEHWRTGLYDDRSGKEEYVPNIDISTWSEWVTTHAQLPVTKLVTPTRPVVMDAEVVQLQTQIKALEARLESARSQIEVHKKESAEALAAMEAMVLKHKQNGDRAKQIEADLKNVQLERDMLKQEKKALEHRLETAKIQPTLSPDHTGRPGELDLQDRESIIETLANLKAATNTTIPSELAQPEFAEGDLTIEQVEVHTQQSTLGFWQQDLVIDISFDIPPATVQHTGEPSPFRLEILGIGAENGVSQAFASLEDTLDLTERQHTRRLVFGIPEPGKYELQTKVVLLSPRKLIGVHCGPTLSITP